MADTVVYRGAVKLLGLDRSGRILRRFEWSGGLLADENETLEGGYLDGKPIHIGGDDDDGLNFPKLPGDDSLLRPGRIELTPGGGRLGPPETPTPPSAATTPEEKPEEKKKIELKPYVEFPPSLPDGDPDEKSDDPDDPFGPFGPYGPFGPFGPHSGNDIYVFPHIPWLGPWQEPAEKGLQKALVEFLKGIGGHRGALDTKDWEKAAEKSGLTFGKEFTNPILQTIERQWFGGRLTLDRLLTYAEDEPLISSIAVALGLAGYGGFEAFQCTKQGKFRIDISPISFEYDCKTHKWSFSIHFSFNW